MTLSTWPRAVAALIVVVVFCSHCGVNTIRPSDRPSLQDLQSFGTSDGKRIDMAEHIGPIGSKFGTCLLDDDDGVLFKNIESSKAHAGITGILNEVFYQFLAGRGKRPETWTTFVNCLRVARLNFLADSIEAAYEQASSIEAAFEQTSIKNHPANTITKPVPAVAPTPSVQRSVPPKPDKTHPIKKSKFSDFYYGFNSVSCYEWEDLCKLLNVDAATIKDLKSPTYYGSNVERKTFCLQEFFDTGQATWEHVMHTIASDPLNKVVGAKEIGFERDIDYYAVMGIEKPMYTLPQGHHKIKKFSDLKYALNRVDSDDWEVICELLNVDEPTLAALKQIKYVLMSSLEKFTFCLVDYLVYGVATWEHVIQVVASSPLDQIVTAKDIGDKYGINYHAVMGLEKPVRSTSPNDHKIKKFNDLVRAMRTLDLDYWLEFCQILKVDQGVIDDLKTFKRWRGDQVKWDRCVREYFDSGGATWEEVVHIIASDPFEKIIKAKEIAREHGISYQAVMSRDEL